MKAIAPRLMASIGIVGLAATFAPPPSHAAEKILFNCFFPPQHYVCRKMLPELGSRIEKATAGRVTITIPPKSVAAPPDQYDAVVNGVVDGALQFNTFIANKVVGIQIAQLPFVGIEAAEPASVALWRTYQKFFADKDEYKGVVLLSVYVTNGAEFFSTTDTPIRTVEDVKNRKMWALPGSTANLIKETGAPVVAGPAVQMLETISKGVVDGYVGVGVSAAQVFKLTPYTKSVTVFKNKIFQPSFSFFVSDKKWGQISATDREAIRKAMGEDYARWAGALQDAEDKANQVKFYDAGVKRIDGSDAELAKFTALGQPTIDAWIKRVGAMKVDGKAAIAYYQATIDEELAKMKK